MRTVRIVALRRPDPQGAGDAIRAASIKAALEEAGVEVRCSAALGPGEGLATAVLKPAVLLRGLVLLLHHGGWRQPLQCVIVESLMRTRSVAPWAQGELPVFITARVVPRDPPELFVVDFVDSLALNMRSRAAASRGLTRLMWSLECRRMGSWETKTAARAAASAAVSTVEAQAIGDGVRGVPLEISETLEVDAPHDQAPRQRHVIFAGSLFYAPNAEAVDWIGRELLPELLIRGWSPQDVVIAGRRPTAKTVELAKTTGMTLKRDVADLVGEISRASVALAPIVLGSGVQTKVLNALLVGTPIVMSPRANRGLDLNDGHSVRILERDPAAWAEAIDELVRLPPLQRHGNDALEVLRRSAPDAVRRQWRDMILPLIEAP